MARRAGRRRLENDGKTSPAGTPPTDATIYGDLTPTQDAFARLHPVDKSPIVCRLCRLQVVEIPHHLQVKHPNISVADYELEFPGAPLRPAEAPNGDDGPSSVNQKVTKEEEAKHPGGRHGVLMERELDRSERRGFRDDLEALKERGFPVGAQMASLAYFQTIQRRLVREIEEIRRTANNKISSSEKLKMLRELGLDVQRMLTDFEKAKAAEREQGNALSIVEQELVEAEAFIQSKIGEFDMACPSCHVPLTAPGLPDWAFDPLVIEDEKGKRVTYPVWSPELWRLVLDRKIPLYIMAFVLRTSPEGLKYTCTKRRQEWPDWIVLENEERELNVLIKQQEKEWEIRNAKLVPTTPPASKKPAEPEDDKF